MERLTTSVRVGPRRIGTAGWAIPKAVRGAFPTEGVALARYAARFDAAEINATFYRAPRPTTLPRWAATVPDGFRFSLKVPKTVSHEARLVDVGELLSAFVAQARTLGDRLGPLLLQLPPSLGFEPKHAGPACRRLRDSGAPVACEPRHASWFTAEADELLAEWGVARVAADPALHAGGGEPGGWRGLTYRRLHGSPRIYWSAYDDAVLMGLAASLRDDPAAERWCIFDNTASGAATANALDLKEQLATE